MSEVQLSEFQRLNHCAKRPIDIWTNYIYYTLSLRLVYTIRKVQAISPNGITLFSLLLALIGCFFFSRGTRAEVLWGLLFLQVSYVFDCADGQLARFRQQYSPIGGWLDQVADRIKEFASYFTLAYGYTRVHGRHDTSIWMWAMVSIFALYLLEYYGQIHMKPLKKTSSPKIDPGASADEASAEELTPADSFGKLQHLRSFVPFRGFIIGEQYFAMLVFILLGKTYAFLIFVAILGLLMCIYRPVIQYIKLRREASAT